MDSIQQKLHLKNCRLLMPTEVLRLSYETCTNEQTALSPAVSTETNQR